MTRRNYADIRKCVHAWANSPTRDSGKCGNVFFEDGKLYSYGYHFVIARILPGVNANGDRVAVFGLHSYSSSTARQQSYARNAWNPQLRPTVWAHDPDANAAANKEETARAIDHALSEAVTTRRIRQATRDAHKAEAYRLAEQFNNYLAALPEAERIISPFDLSHNSLETSAEVRAEVARKAKEDAARLQAERIARAQETAAAWRTGASERSGLINIPPMLRLVRGKGLHTGGLRREGNADVIETSHGAEIPASCAPALWRMVKLARSQGAALQALDLPDTRIAQLGAFALRTIRADGSIVVGCHDIAYTELENIAREMGLIDAAQA